MFNSEDHPHLRLNPLTNEWVIVSPHRLKRPWSGQIEPAEDEAVPQHDLNNPLCPGATRSSGKVNDNYNSTYVFENDFPALLTDIPGPPEEDNDDLFVSKKATGTCRVMCFHPHSDLSLPLMTHKEIEAVVVEWIRQYKQLSQQYQWVQIFENKGKMNGCSNPHPHSQIYGCGFLPNHASKEEACQLEYYRKKNTCMLLDYVRQETKKKVRIVVENDEWLVVVPYWASWPFELLLLTKRPTQRLTDLNEKEIKSLVIIMKTYLIKYDNLFKASFPYSMGWHCAPSTSHSPHWQLHAHYYPPLVRSATVKKHMVGFEQLSGEMREFTPEKAAQTLRDLPAVHYKEKTGTF